MSKFIDFSAYNKHQVFLTSGRVVINAREDNLFLLSKKDLVISSGGDVHVNVGFKGSKSATLIVNSPKIQLGLGSTTNQVEPIAKADSLVKSLNALTEELSKFLQVLTTAQGVSPSGPVTLVTINEAAKSLGTSLSQITREFNKIKSSVSYTS